VVNPRRHVPSDPAGAFSPGPYQDCKKEEEEPDNEDLGIGNVEERCIVTFL